MQALIVIPPRQVLQQYGGPEQALMQDVAGVPLLVRTIATAMRAGVDSLFVIWPHDVDSSIWERCAAAQPLHLRVDKLVWQGTFNPRSPACWTAIAASIAGQFLWLPWNWVTHSRVLAGLLPMPVRPAKWEAPALIERSALMVGAGVRLTSDPPPDGVPIYSRSDVGRAERFLVANSGKSTDNFYSKFNRFLCRPVVRLLTHTRVTPNAVTVAGLVIGIVSALLYARGTYAYYVCGGLLFFLSGLVDEMDGMLARLKFKESAFGTWFEGSVDNATYLLVFAGITAGLYRQRGPHEVIYGVALLTGCLLSVILTSLHRKIATTADRPHEYARRIDQMMEADSSNWISWITRGFHIYIKKGVAIHYLLLFTLVGVLPLFLRLAAIGSHLTWVMVLYFNRRFFSRTDAPATKKALENAA